MILGLDRHPAAACFVELDDAVRAMTGRVVCFNAHAYPDEIPPGAIVYNLENPEQVSDHARERWKAHEVWDFSERNAAVLGARHVPIGFHPSMERFQRAEVQDIDVIFTGCINERRAKVLQDLAEHDLNVVVVPTGIYGAKRDDALARAKLALNMRFYEDGVFPALRVAHLVANRVPVLSERSIEQWNWVPHTGFGDLVSCARNAIQEGLEMAEHAYQRFVQMPMVLPC
jgi:hypothetical protein